MNLSSSFSNPSFKGRREDINELKSLSENNMPILPNKRNLILSAIDNLGKTGERQDIEMLMGTVETMKYGIQNNSEFAKALNGTQGEKENTDWDGILKNTIQNAINGTNEEDKAALEARFQKIFGEDKPLTEQEKTMLDLRSDILGSKEMLNVLDNPEKTLESARIRENLDYFLASSEINTDDKVKCLGLMKHFLSDDYEIHPQLKDHKVQAFSEMLNDLIVKRPDEEVYTIKDVSQKQTGMCAAISIARKTIAYEDKVRAMEIMMAELDNKPTMEVYDRTAIGTGKKIEIEKAHVDFTDGMKKGYRIVDTGTHQWMNAADTVGDGSIKEGHYQAFDPDNYEIFRDAHWKNDLPAEYKPAQNWLRYLNKEDGAIATAMRRSSDIAKIQKEIGENKKGFETEIVKSNAAIRKAIKEIDPSVSDEKASALTHQILKADKAENPEFKLIDREPVASKNQKLAALIKSELPNASEAVLNEKIDSIRGLRELSEDASAKLDKLKKHSTPQAIFAHNKNLFTAAAHHRRSVQAELDVPERLSAYEKTLNIPVREGLVQDSAQKILNNLSSQAVVNNAAEKFGVDANADSVKVAVNKALKETEVTIPAKLDNILGQMQMGDRVSVITSFLDSASEKIKAGDKETLQNYAENAHVKPNEALVLKKIETVKASLADNPSNKQIAEAVNLLGYNNQIEMTADMYKTFADAVDSGAISQEQLTAVFGNNADKKIANLGKQIQSAANKQAQIEKQFGLPSRKDVVLNVLEATGEIVSEKTLQDMQAKFDKVAEVKAESDNRIVDPSVKKPTVPDSVYKFTPEEKETYAKIEAKLPAWKTYSKVNSQAMNKALEPQLNALYAEAGRLTGHLWVGGEGESGLFDNQSIKVLEMITGKHYYNEEDTDKVVEHIKSGLGSGTSSTNVSHKEYSGHAQYVAEVSQVPVIDPETKETVMKDVLWHDNTWGRAEDKNVWTDENGVRRADYGNGYGGPDGYVFDPRLLTGTFVDDTKYQVGVTGDGSKFRLWTAVRLAGENPEAEKKLDGVINDIMDIGQEEEKVAEFEEMLRKAPAVDMATMDNASEMMSKLSESYLKKIENAEVQTEADLDKIKDKNVKFLLEKTALQMSVPTQTMKDYITNILDENAIAEVKSKLPEIQKEMISEPFLKGKQAPKQVFINAQDEILDAFNTAFADGDVPKNLQSVFDSLMKVPAKKLDGSLANLKEAMIENVQTKLAKGIKDPKKAAALTEQISEIIANTVDNKMTIKSLDDFNKQYGETAKLLTKYVDKKFNPSSDEELLANLQKLQNMTNKEYNAFMADATPEDLGLKDVSAVDVARQINAQKGIPTDLFSANTRIQVIYSAGPDNQEAPEWAYHSMKQGITPVENTAFIGNMAKTMYAKYGVRAAFPEASVMNNQEIALQVADELDVIKSSVEQIAQISEKGEAVAVLNAEIQDFVKGNLTEKYQAKTIGLINSYVKAVRTGSPEADKIAQDINSVVTQGHIAKHPKELLHAFVKEVQAENPNENRIDTLRNYLTEAVRVSDIANVEYGLIDNAEKGIETMTKQAFDNYNLTTKDGKTIPLSSDEGVLFLVDKLANPTNDSTALQVLFTQTGLSEKAVDMINKSMKPQAISQMCDEAGASIKAIFGNIDELKAGFETFAKENSVSFGTYKDAVKYYIKTLDKEYAKKTDDEKQVYNAYKAFLLKTQNADFAKTLNPAEILPTLQQVHELGVNSLTNQGAQVAESLNTLVETVEKRLSAMKALKLPENSSKEAARQKFIGEAEAAYQKIVETIDSVNNSVA
ncbi:MAG: hypothetical protein K6C94_02720 [Candidatus Gastranaerophilales bacterium]|nr:hypothetical protein [Candidatus Gastranaerophilales bacterium]